MHVLKTATIALAAVLSVAATNPQSDWTGKVTVTPTQTHVIGNPEARVKVTEFLSYTCSHCAHFHRESEGPLRISYLPAGKVSIEVQHLVRDPVDLAAALLANCGGPKLFYRVHNTILQTQDGWLPTMGKASDAQKQRWSTGTVTQRLQAIASDFGFYKVMEGAGIDRVATDRCLADEVMTRKLLDQTDAAVSAGVTGTPSFMINGTLLEDTHDWQALDTAIKARL